MATFKERFLELKKEKDVSLDILAKEFHTNKSSLSRVVNGELQLKADMQQEMASYFGVSIDYLMGISDTRQLNKSKDILVKALGYVNSAKSASSVVGATMGSAASAGTSFAVPIIASKILEILTSKGIIKEGEEISKEKEEEITKILDKTIDIYQIKNDK